MFAGRLDRGVAAELQVFDPSFPAGETLTFIVRNPGAPVSLFYSSPRLFFEADRGEEDNPVALIISLSEDITIAVRPVRDGEELLRDDPFEL